MNCKSIFIINIISLIILTSCFFTHRGIETESIDDFYSEINELGEHNTANVKLLDGTYLSVKNLFISVDITTGSHYDTDSSIVLPTSRILSVTFYDHSRGAFGGFTIGLVAGFTMQLISYSFWKRDVNGEGLWPFFEYLKVPFLAAGIGMLVGGILGEKKEYIINEVNR